MITQRENESLDSMMKRFKSEVANAGILVDYRKHLEYVSPSKKRRLKSQAAQKRLRKYTKV